MTPIEPKRYLDHLRAEATLLLDAARQAGTAAAVPTCPEWTVADLLSHVGSVYSNKVACMRLQRRPAETEWLHEAPAGDAVFTWVADRLAELETELASRDPASPSYTWFPADQTVGFWFRRMAQETLVHRLDAELAAKSLTPVDDTLALDGIDEMLAVFLAGPWWEDEPVPSASGRTVQVAAGDDAWRVTLQPTAVLVEPGRGAAAAQVEGAAADMLLWTWGREPISPVSVTGDESAAAELQQRLAHAAE